MEDCHKRDIWWNSCEVGDIWGAGGILVRLGRVLGWSLESYKKGTEKIKGQGFSFILEDDRSVKFCLHRLCEDDPFCASFSAVFCCCLKRGGCVE